MQFPIHPINIQEIVDNIPIRIAAIGIFLILVMRFGNPIKAYKNLREIMKDKSHIEKAIDDSEERCAAKILFMESKLDSMQIEIEQCALERAIHRNQLKGINRLAKEVEESGKGMSPHMTSKLFEILSERLERNKE